MVPGPMWKQRVDTMGSPEHWESERSASTLTHQGLGTGRLLLGPLVCPLRTDGLLRSLSIQITLSRHLVSLISMFLGLTVVCVSVCVYVHTGVSVRVCGGCAAGV